jgi:hypothetical protein
MRVTSSSVRLWFRRLTCISDNTDSDEMERSTGLMAIVRTPEKSKPGPKSIVAVGVLEQAATRTKCDSVISIRALELCMALFSLAKV